MKIQFSFFNKRTKEFKNVPLDSLLVDDRTGEVITDQEKVNAIVAQNFAECASIQATANTIEEVQAFAQAYGVSADTIVLREGKDSKGKAFKFYSCRVDKNPPRIYTADILAGFAKACGR